VQTAGKEMGRTLVHVLIGLIIGAMISLREVTAQHRYRPLSGAMAERVRLLGDAFRRIVFAQVRIAALNAFFTAIYLVVVLPMFGVNLPLTKTLILITFLAGLLPVVGNLISNTVIVIVSLGQSLQVAMASLLFLIVIHKLEYFLNARIIGTQIRSHAWELLLAMLAMEAAFGIMGVVAAPIYYAYLKSELTQKGLI
jgi:predicted PurR-regulated permease PerM